MFNSKPGDDLHKLGLSARAYNALMRAGVRRIVDLQHMRDEDLLEIRNLGLTALAEIQAALRAYRARGDSEPASPTAEPYAKQLPLSPSHASPRAPWETLPEKDREVVERHYGLKTGKRDTFDLIGIDWKVSRARVQQVHKRAMDRLALDDQVRQWVDKLAAALQALGGLANHGELAEALRLEAQAASVHAKGLIYLLRDAGEVVRRFKVGDEYLFGQARNPEPETCDGVVAAANAALRGRAPMAEEDAVRLVLDQPRLSAGATENYVRAVFRVHPSFDRSPDDRVSVKRDGRPAGATPISQPVVYPTRQSPVPQVRRPLPPSAESRPEPTVHTTRSAQSAPEPAPEPTLPEPPSIENEPVPQPLWEPSAELAEWESKLRPQLVKASLVGEVYVTQTESAQLGAAVGRLLKNAGRRNGVSYLERRYPSAFAVFMVGQGVYGYDGGDVWSAIGRALDLNLDGNWHGELGQLLERVIKSFRLPDFPEMRAQAARYRSLILAHGGVPVYCLADFFQFVVAPDLKQPSGLALEARLEEALGRARRYADKPVTYFLENGGLVAADFFERSCALAAEWLTSRTLAAASDAGLPEHVVAFFGGWAPAHLAAGRRTRALASHLRRPELALAPWEDGLVLRLPAQPVSALGASQAEWIVPEIGRTLAVQARFGQTTAATVPLHELQPHFTIKLETAGRAWDWELEGARENVPLLVFDPATGRRLPRPVPGECWLLFPQSHTVSVLAGDGWPVEELPPVAPGWRAEGWDLSAAEVLGLQAPGAAPQSLPVRRTVGLKPTLTGGHCLSGAATDDALDVYVGSPPSVRVPLSPVGERGSVPGDWTIILESEDEVVPARRTGLALLLAGAGHRVASDTIEVNLAHSSLLGPAPFGCFHVKIQGPMGRDAAFTFACLPAFTLEGLDRLALPDPKQGPAQLVGHIQVTPVDRIELGSGSRQASLRCLRPGSYEIAVPPSLAALDLHVVRDLDDNEVRVPLSVPLRRVQWRLTGPAAEGADWSGRPLVHPLALLLGEPTTALLVDLPGIESDAARVSLRLINIDSETRQELALQRPRHSAYFRCSLAAFNDTLRTMLSPILRFELNLELSEGGRVLSARMPVLELTRELQLENLRFDVRPDPQGSWLSLTWTEYLPLRSRVLYLWPVWRPWEAPQVFRVPDEARGTFECLLPNTRFPAGLYRAWLAVLDPWHTGESPGLPARGDRGTHEIQLGQPVERVQVLESASTLADAFACDLERLHLPAGLIDEASQREAFHWLCDHLELAQPKQLLALARLSHQADAAWAPGQFAERLFEPAHVKRLLGFQATETLTAEEFEILVGVAPPPDRWSDETCLALANLSVLAIRTAAITELAKRRPTEAASVLFDLVDAGSLAEEEFVLYLASEKYVALDWLERRPPSALGRRLIKLLAGAAILVQPDMWLECNAGVGRIGRIEEPGSGVSIDQFFEDEGGFRLHVALHVELDYELRGEAAVIDMPAGQIRFPRAGRLFICPKCGLMSTRLDVYRMHLSYIRCDGPYDLAPQANKPVALTHLRFFNRRATKN